MFHFKTVWHGQNGDQATKVFTADSLEEAQREWKGWFHNRYAIHNEEYDAEVELKSVHFEEMDAE
jgi:hypothetical protein